MSLMVASLAHVLICSRMRYATLAEVSCSFITCSALAMHMQPAGGGTKQPTHSCGSKERKTICHELMTSTCSFFSSRFISVIALSLSFTFCMQEQQMFRPHCQHISTCPRCMDASCYM